MVLLGPSYGLTRVAVPSDKHGVAAVDDQASVTIPPSNLHVHDHHRTVLQGRQGGSLFDDHAGSLFVEH